MARYGSSTIFTSALYPVVAVEAIAGVSGLPIHAPYYDNAPPEQIIQGVSWLSGTIAATLVSYTNWPVEGVQQGGVSFQSGAITLGLLSYTNWPVEGIQQGGVAFQSGTITLGLISYTNWPVEGVQQSGISWISGTIT